MEMVQTKNLNEALATVVQETAADLDPHAVATLVAHPDAVRAALAVAADALQAKGTDKGITVIKGTESGLPKSLETDRRIAKRTRMGKKEDLLTSEQCAARTGLKTRQSVHDWLKKGQIIGWQGAKRGYLFPARQFDELGGPPKGLDRITPLFEDGYVAWCWLTTPLAALGGAEPLDLLCRGETGRVEAAAKGDLQGDFA